MLLSLVPWNGVFVTEDFDRDDEGYADSEKEDAWITNGGCDVDEGGHDEVDGLVKIKQGEECCGIYEVKDGLLHMTFAN